MNAKLKGALQILLLVVVAVALGFVSYMGLGNAHKGSAKNIRLGLDLAGGVSVTYEAQKKNPTAQEMADTVYKMQKRVENESTEASVYQEGNNRVTIDVPDVDDPQAVLDKLGRAGSLEFIMEADLKSSEAEVIEAAGETADIETAASEDGTTTYYYSKGDVKLDGSMVSTAEATTQKSNTGAVQNVVSITFTGKGAKKFGNVTSNHVGDNMSIIYDGTLVSSPVIQAAITDGKAIIEGSFDKFSDAEDMATILRVGALPLELKNIRSNIVGATLGVSSLKTSLYAGVVGFILVILFMIFMYRMPGVASSLALVVYILMVLLTLNVLNVTLTLPGIAGIILSVGMAVDANCIIFTRIREEITTGKTVKSSIKLGFEKALSAIIDGNITTLIVAVMLYIKGSGTVKGFAQTLAIGIIISMITAIFITRWILSGFVNLGLENEKFFGKVKTLKEIHFVQNLKKCAIISICLFAVCVIGLFVNKNVHGSSLNYSLDFTGGTSTSIKFPEGAEGFNSDGNAEVQLREELEDLVKSSTGVTDVDYSDVSGERTVILRTTVLSEDQSAKLVETIESKYGVAQDQIESETISASVSDEMKRDAVISVILASLLMLLYIWIRFKNLAFGIGAVIPLLHDVIIVLTVYVVGFSFISVGSTFIACMLTIVGYSINATIVIFDRIRENHNRATSREDVAQTVNLSITQTLTRSIYTSLTTLIMVVVLAIMGVDAVRQFAIPLIVGIVSGTYSSVCLAGPIWYYLNKVFGKRQAAKKAEAMKAAGVTPRRTRTQPQPKKVPSQPEEADQAVKTEDKIPQAQPQSVSKKKKASGGKKSRKSRKKGKR